MLALLVWVGLIAHGRYRLRGAIAALPAAAQDQTFRSAYEQLATVCSTQPGLEAHCRDEAELILHFPQCGAECQTLARRFFPVGTK